MICRFSTAHVFHNHLLVQTTTIYSRVQQQTAWPRIPQPNHILDQCFTVLLLYSRLLAHREWPNEALKSVALSFFNDVEMESEGRPNLLQVGAGVIEPGSPCQHAGSTRKASSLNRWTCITSSAFHLTGKRPGVVLWVQGIKHGIGIVFISNRGAAAAFLAGRGGVMCLHPPER